MRKLLGKNAIKTFAIALAFLVLCGSAGCSSTSYWRNANPLADWKRDLYECERENMQPWRQGKISGVEPDYGMTKTCVELRGWREVDR